jgi:hypothetical protein
LAALGPAAAAAAAGLGSHWAPAAATPAAHRQPWETPRAVGNFGAGAGAGEWKMWSQCASVSVCQCVIYRVPEIARSWMDSLGGLVKVIRWPGLMLR